jgi:HAD superfamily hydrolase (TIGR01509 family)
LSSRARASSRISALVFDLDGVLLDSEQVWDGARRELVAAAGRPWQERATREMQGMSAPEWSLYLHEELGVPLEPREISGRVAAKVLDSYRSRLPLLAGAKNTVRTLSSHWHLALASSANRDVIDAVLSLADLTACFSATVSSEEVARGKPAPDVYLAAARALGLEPAQCAAVEDSSNGLRAAAAAGMTVIAVPNRDYPPASDALSLADLTVRSLEQLTPEAIASLMRAART